MIGKCTIKQEHKKKYHHAWDGYFESMNNEIITHGKYKEKTMIRWTPPNSL